MGMAHEFKTTFDNLLEDFPKAIKVTIWPTSNGRGELNPPSTITFRFDEQGLNGKDAFGYPIQQQQANLGALGELQAQMQVKEIRNEFGQLIQAERFENEKRELNREIKDLKDKLSQKEQDMRKLELENREIHGKAQRDFWGWSGKLKQGAQTVGGFLMGAFQQAFPNLSKKVMGGMEIAMAGLTGIPSPGQMEQLLANGGNYNPDEEYEEEENVEPSEGALLFPSPEAVEILQTFEEGEIRMLNRLILQICAIEDASERRKLIEFAYNFLGGKAPKGNKAEQKNSEQPAASSDVQRKKPHGFVVRRSHSSAQDEVLPPQEEHSIEQPPTNPPSAQSFAQGFLDNDPSFDNQ
jgi:hypothetical protein